MDTGWAKKKKKWFPVKIHIVGCSQYWTFFGRITLSRKISHKKFFTERLVLISREIFEHIVNYTNAIFTFFHIIKKIFCNHDLRV